MTSQSVLVFLALATTVAAVFAEPGMGLPPAGVMGFARGSSANVVRVGALMNERARAKFREPAVGVAVVDREYVVTFRRGSPASAVTRVARQISTSGTGVQLKYVGNYELGWRGLTFKVPEQSPQETARLLEELLVIPGVKVAEANQVITKSQTGPAADTPNKAPATPPNKRQQKACAPLKDTDTAKIVKGASGQDWGLDRIDTRQHVMSNTYEYATSGSSANVYVVDTGVQLDHPEIKGRAFGAGAGGFDAFGGDAQDSHGHGTHCSGTIGGKTTGIAKNTTIFSVRVLDESGSGTIDTLIEGLNFVANSKRPNRIASMSLGGGLSEALNIAVESAVKAGVLVIVAAGNEASNACEVSPASAASAITVGAFDSEDVKATFSNFGKCVDIWAPGVGIYSSTIPSSYATWSGTSMATPHVAGVAARLWSKGVCKTNIECAEAIRCLGTSGLVKELDADSPNLMLYIPPGV